jgi:molybdopterin converting factor small subunit
MPKRGNLFGYTQITSEEIMRSDVTVEIYPWLSKALGAQHKVTLTEQISRQETLRSLLDRLALKYDGVGAMIYDGIHERLYEGIVIFVNNKLIPHDLLLPLTQGDHIAVTPFYIGG